EKVVLPVVVLQHLAEQVGAQPHQLRSLIELITTGEQLQITPDVRTLLGRLPACSLHNHYGPSETHVVTAATLADDPSAWPALPSIGRPIANTQMYIVDRQMQPVPIGVVGDLYIGGDSLARGYLDRPDLTAEKFVPNPFVKDEGGRMQDESGRFILHPSSFILYKTGDLARYRSDGAIEFLGRIDHQVKIRGMRMELGEVEAAVCPHPAVREAVILPHEITPGNKSLVAYVVSKQEPLPTSDE